jgi:hypothetical protein
MAAATIRDRLPHRPRQEEILVGGSPIALRMVQQVIWSGVSAVLAASLIAGGYFLITQVEWHFGPVHFGMKSWWDGGMGFIHASWWDIYRHGLRNLWEPALATLFVKSLLANKWRREDVRVSGLWLIISPLLLFVATTILVIGGIWVLDFGAPNLWHALFGNDRVANPIHLPHGLSWLANFLQDWNWQVVLVGILVGQVVHRLWAPVGNTIQGFFTDRAVRKQRSRRIAAWKVLARIRTGATAVDDALTELAIIGVGDPLWVKYPLTPPVVRERYALTIQTHAPVRSHGKVDRGLVISISTVAVLVMLVGLLARYGIANGLHVPYLAP